MSRDGLMPKRRREGQPAHPHARPASSAPAAWSSRSSPPSCRWRRSSSSSTSARCSRSSSSTLGVWILRHTNPDMERGYRVPLVPWFPIIGILLCVYLATNLEARDVAALLRLDGDRPRHLLPLRLPPLAPAPGRGRRRPTPSFPAPRSRFAVSGPRGRAGVGRGSVSRRRSCMSRSVLVAALMALGLFTPSLAQAADELSTSNRLDDRRFVTIRAARLRARHRGRAATPPPASTPAARWAASGPRRSSSSTASGSASASDWIGPATRFTSGYGHVKMRLPAQRRAERRAHRLRARRAPRRARRPAPRGPGQAHGQAAHADALRADVDLPLGRDDAVRQTDLQPAPTGALRRPLARLHRVRHAAGRRSAARTTGAPPSAAR